MHKLNLKTKLFGYDPVEVCQYIQELEDKYYQITSDQKDEIELLRRQTELLKQDNEETLRLLEKQMEQIVELEKQTARVPDLEAHIRTLTAQQTANAALAEKELLPLLEQAVQMSRQLTRQGDES